MMMTTGKQLQCGCGSQLARTPGQFGLRHPAKFFVRAHQAADFKLSPAGQQAELAQHLWIDSHGSFIQISPEILQLV
jgi:hypothetical protein